VNSDDQRPFEAPYGPDDFSEDEENMHPENDPAKVLELKKEKKVKEQFQITLKALKNDDEKRRQELGSDCEEYLQSGYMYIYQLKSFRTLDFKGDIPDQKGVKDLNNEHFSALTKKFLYNFVYEQMKKDFQNQLIESLEQVVPAPKTKKKNKKKKKEEDGIVLTELPEEEAKQEEDAPRRR